MYDELHAHISRSAGATRCAFSHSISRFRDPTERLGLKLKLDDEKH